MASSITRSILQLKNKVERLEETVQKLQSKTKDMITGIGFTVYTKNLLNKNITDNYKFRLKTLENTNHNTQFFQVKIKFLNYFEQNISFNLFIDNLQIASDTQTYKKGINETVVFGNYTNLVDNKIVIELQVKPRAKKQLTILNTTLTVWGESGTQDADYSAAETQTKYFLSYISDERLYYKFFEKNTDANELDFNFYEESISHSTCAFDDTIYLFRVDPDGNLFFSTADDFNEKFICGDVSKVSCCGNSQKIIFCYIKNGECYYGEIKNNIVISNNKLTTPFGTYKNCCVTFNSYNNKCYIVITKTNNSNYLLESIQETKSLSENISASVNLQIEIMEEN